MRILKIMLSLLVFLIGSTTAEAQNEAVVKYNLTTRCIPEDASSAFPNSARYAPEDSIHLQAVPNDGFIFLRWEDESGNEVSGSGDYDFTMPSHDVTLTAVFEFAPEYLPEPGLPMFILSLKANPSEGVSSFSGVGNHVGGTAVEVGTSPAEHYIFDNWTDEQGKVVSEDLGFSYTMPERHSTLTANFHYDFDPSDLPEPGLPKFILSLKSNPSEGSASLSGADEYISGTEVEVSASPSELYLFDNWTDEQGEIVSEDLSFSYTMPERHTELTANFHYDFDPSDFQEPGQPKFILSLKSNPSDGSASLSGAGEHISGSEVEVSASPAERYLFDNWTDEQGKVVSEDLSFSYTMPERHTALTANFHYNFDADDIGEPEMPSIGTVSECLFNREDDTHITIECATPGAKIYYTLDGTDPTVKSSVYTDVVILPGNVTVKAFAVKYGMADSPISEYVVEGLTVDTPTFEYNNLALSLAVTTEGSEIRYTLDGNIPTVSSNLYTTPLKLTSDCTVVARGFKNYYDPSDTISYKFVYADHQVATPEVTHSLETLKVTMSCSTIGAAIRYTTDGTLPTDTTGFLYTGPIDLKGNIAFTVRAFHEDFFESNTNYYVVSDLTVAPPICVFDSSSRILALSCNTEGASIFYSFDKEGEWKPYTGPISIDGNCTVFAKATLQDYNDSEISEIVISDIRCDGVNFSYNGRFMRIATTEPNARILYTTDGSDPSFGSEYFDELDIMGLCSVRAVAVKERLLNSEIGEFLVDHYSDEAHAETAAGGLLESSFAWSGSDLPQIIESFRIVGILNDSDYRFLNSMKGLRHLDIEKVTDAHIPDRAFLNSRLISVSLPEDLSEYGEDIFSEAECLSSLRWNSKTQNVDSCLTDCLDNPNVLVYIPAGTTVGHSQDLNIVTEDRAASVTLHYGRPYYAAWDFRADYVGLTREFRQETEIGICRGWETLVLPFAPTSITHETLGEAVPFAAWNYKPDPYSAPKPFWLYGSTATGWEEAAEIEAGMPYIISMPNNPDYVYTHNLAGRITFSATGVDLGPDSGFALSAPWMDATVFEGTFMPVEEEGILTLNVGDTSGDLLPGSTFVAEERAIPFTAYVRGAAGRKAMPVFGDMSSIDLPTLFGGSLLIETPAPGMLRISSSRERKVAVATATGVIIRTLHIKAGESVTLEGLTRDLYIVGGVKVMVR